MSPLPVDDEFWRRHDELLGVVPSGSTEITNRLPVVPAGAIQPAPTTDAMPIDIAALEREVSETVQRAVDAERRAAQRDALLRSVVQAFEQQLDDLEAEHARRLDAIRLGADAAAERILVEARARAAALLDDLDSRRGAVDRGR